MIINVVAGVVSRESNGTIHFLCGKRSEAMGNGGVWEFPGGKVEEGESNTQTITREFREEMNAVVKNCEELPFITIIEHSPSTDDVQYRVAFHFITLEPTSPVEALEHDQLVWIGKDDLKQYPWAHTQRPVIEYLMTHKIETGRKV